MKYDLYYSKKNNKPILTQKGLIRSKKIKQGFYTCYLEEDNRGKISPVIKKMSNKAEKKLLPTNYKPLNKSLTMRVFTDEFNERQMAVNKLIGRKTKKSVLLHGPAGTGKSVLMASKAMSLMKFIPNSFAVYVNKIACFKHVIEFCINSRKSGIKAVPIILFDECEYYFKEYSSTLKELLDSPVGFDKFIFIGATNNLADIPKEMYENRPSRLELIEVGCLKTDEQIMQIMHMINSNYDERCRLTKSQLNSILKDINDERKQDKTTSMDVITYNMALASGYYNGPKLIESQIESEEVIKKIEDETI